MFHFNIPGEHEKAEVFWCFQEVWKLNIDLKLIKVKLNNFVNSYLIFICSYPQAELYPVELQYTVNGTWSHNF